jgi:hypothetical protein
MSEDDPPAPPSMTVEIFYVPSKPGGRRWEAIVPGTMGCGGSPMVALIDLANNLEKGVPS